MIIEGNMIKAEEGKILYRITDKSLCGDVYYLGYIYYLNGEKLAEPYLETPSDFEDLTPDEYINRNFEEYSRLIDGFIRERYSINDEFAIQRQRDTKKEEFQRYFDFCEECKARARKELGL